MTKKEAEKYLIENDFKEEIVEKVLEEGKEKNFSTISGNNEIIYCGSVMGSFDETFEDFVLKLCKKNGKEYGEKLEIGDMVKTNDIYWSVISNNGVNVNIVSFKDFKTGFLTKKGKKWRVDFIEKSSKVIPSWHSETEAVIQYKEIRIYAFLGMFMPKTLWRSIIDRTISAKEAMKIKNLEVRQRVVERLGWEKVFKDLDAALISKDQYGELWDIDLQDDWRYRKARFLKFIDPSENDKEGFLRVHPDCKTPQEAIAWSYSLINLGFDYNPDLRL